MSKKNFSIYLIVFLSILILIRNSGAEIKIGDEAPSFTLPSTQDRLVYYYKDYYGKYHLIITFFPAAFTPI